jgi:hypothetical protein
MSWAVGRVAGVMINAIFEQLAFVDADGTI